MYTTLATSSCVVPEQRGGVASALLEQVALMGDEELTVRARELAGEISAAEANLAAVLAEVERREIHERWECRSIERFAGWHLQQTPNRARALADVGRAMGELPVMAEAVADGTLSFDKARSITRVAAPDTEGALVELALHATTAQTQRICGQWRKVDERNAADTTDAAVEDPPMLLVVTDDDGITMTIRFDHVRGQLVLAAIDTAAAEVRDERAHAAPMDPDGPGDPGAAPGCDEDRSNEKRSKAEWRALGLLRLAENEPSSLDGLRPSGFTAAVVAHVGVDTLYGPDLPDPTARSPKPLRDEMAELEPAGVRIRRDSARWLACDADLLTVLEDPDGNPLHTGRLHRSIPLSLRRAVMARFRTCAWPGCTATAVQLHHVQHRADGGIDDVDHVVPECLEHHLFIHAHGIWITRDADGTLHHWRADGTEIRVTPSGTGPPSADALHAPDRLTARRLAFGADPHETGRQPRWQGDLLHLGDCIEALQARRERALRAIRPTGAPPGFDATGPPPARN